MISESLPHNGAQEAANKMVKIMDSTACLA